jgi:glycosyltransferase involved in cell wall biosynthesis
MRLLFVSSFHLFPGTRFGGAKRLYYLAREWNRAARLTLICMDGCREWTPGEAVPSEFPDYLMIPATTEPRGWRRFASAPADRRYALEPDRERIRAFLAGKRFDAVLLAYPWALSFLGPLLDGIEAPVFYLEDDLVHDAFLARERAARNPLARAALRFRYRQTVAYYRPRMRAIAAFVGITDQEARAMARTYPELRTEILKYALPLEEYPRLPPGPRDTVGFIGNFAHDPNRDALEWLASELLPALRARRPGTRVALAGRGLTAGLKALFPPDSGVEWRDEVEDLRDFYSGIGVFLNPVRTGRGMRTKVLEAAAFCRPVVSTPLGAEGFEDLELSIAGDSASLADACARLLEGEGPGAAQRNRKIIEERYAVERVASAFLGLMAEARAR